MDLRMECFGGLTPGGTLRRRACLPASCRGGWYLEAECRYPLDSASSYYADLEKAPGTKLWAARSADDCCSPCHRVVSERYSTSASRQHPQASFTLGQITLLALYLPQSLSCIYYVLDPCHHALYLTQTTTSVVSGVSFPPPPRRCDSTQPLLQTTCLPRPMATSFRPFVGLSGLFSVFQLSLPPFEDYLSFINLGGRIGGSKSTPKAILGSQLSFNTATLYILLDLALR
ncbi:hypothetical protein B0I35DRAFT_186467 [Stachybotrys elegans]|uniref:Uncharacterized protein n=1 Tax=Stachybotrys elegans TaxID=80388 RepID=A0A8K0WU27_9HYPO|nr:hypothetical protein B0I35DRAFT_186467 [Stachybotrys elegans]